MSHGLGLEFGLGLTPGFAVVVMLGKGPAPGLGLELELGLTPRLGRKITPGVAILAVMLAEGLTPSSGLSSRWVLGSDSRREVLWLWSC